MQQFVTDVFAHLKVVDTSCQRRINPRIVLARRSLHPIVEAVEPRILLASTTGIFATLNQTPGPSTSALIDVSSPSFRRSAEGKAIVTIVGEATDGRIDPGLISVKSVSPGSLVRVLSSRLDGTNRVVVAALSLGKFRVEDVSHGATRFAFRLAGDVNGDFRVGVRDFRELRMLRRRGNASTDTGGADVDGDGKLSRHDLRLAFHNRAAATSVRPLVASAVLDAASDPNGNGVVVMPGVTIRGRTIPGSMVQVVSYGGSTVAQVASAAKDGTFLASTAVPMGSSTVFAIVSDQFGQAISIGVPVRRRDLAIDWSDTLLAAIRDTKENPPAAARQMAILGVSMYDAVDSIDRDHQPYYRFVDAAAGASREAAVSAAAHDVLVSLLPQQAATFDTLLATSLADIPAGPSKTQGEAIGRAAAGDILALRSGDGSGNNLSAPIGTKPGQWRPTPPAFLPPLLPGWGVVKPFAVTSTTQFRIPPPPALESAEYAEAVDEVAQVGSASSTTRTPQETDTARFWADAAGTWTPPGHWFHIAGDVGSQKNNTISENARMFAQVGMALADSAITCWNDKYDFYLWRPVTAIRLADTDGNAATTANPDWLPLLTTPNFPSDSSGHSTFSAAAATVLASFFGTDDVTFTTAAEGFSVAPRAFTSFTQAAYEAGRSRVLGGIHFTFENLAGRQVGTALGTLRRGELSSAHQVFVD